MKKRQVTIDPIGVVSGQLAARRCVRRAQPFKLAILISDQTILRPKLILVVETVLDWIALELTGEYLGRSTIRSVPLIKLDQRTQLAVVSRLLRRDCWRALRPSIERRILEPSLQLLLDAHQPGPPCNSQITSQRFSI